MSYNQLTSALNEEYSLRALSLLLEERHKYKCSAAALCRWFQRQTIPIEAGVALAEVATNRGIVVFADEALSVWFPFLAPYLVGENQ